MTEEELRRLSEFLYRRTGMIFAESKRYYIQRRVTDRMVATGSHTFASYFARLRSNDQGEIEQFVNAFTVNETYFYREDYQLRCLTTDLLPERTRVKPSGEAVRIWSVPCATGEEPYSIAIWLLENWPEVDSHDVQICGSDIDTQALAAAERGIFGKRALMRLPEEVVAKYFSQLDQEQWQLIGELRQSIQFTPVNLVNTDDMRAHGRFDIIFCRNVLIYFDDASRRVAAENLYENLMPGGYICLGHAESMSRISPLFEVRRFDIIFCRNVLIYFDDASRRVAAENLYENLMPGGYICLGHAESMSRISPLFEVRKYEDCVVYRKPKEADRA